MSAEYHLSTLSVVGAGRNKFEQFIGTRQPLEWIGCEAEEMGYTGVAVVPTRRIARDIVENALTAREISLAGSGGQTFRTEKTIFESLRHPNPILATQAMLTFPHKVDSLQTLLILQGMKPRESFPVVVQTPEDVRKAKEIGIERIAVILSPENMLSVGARDGLHFAEMAYDDGVQVSLDPTYQLFRSNLDGSPSPFENPIETIMQVWKYTGIVNLSLGRTDLGNTNSPNELNDLYTGSHNTKIRQTLMVMRQAIEETNHVPQIVLQIPFSGAAHVLGKTKVTTEDIKRVHVPVLAEVKKILEG